MRAAAADAVGQLVVGGAELLQQLLVGGRLLEGVELRTVDVLQQRIAQHRVVVGRADDGRDGLQPRQPGRAQPPLAHDQLVAAVVGADHDRLQHPELANAVRQLGQRVLVEDRAGLAGVGPDLLDRQVGQRRPRNGQWAVAGRLNIRVLVVAGRLLALGGAPALPCVSSSAPPVASPAGPKYTSVGAGPTAEADGINAARPRPRPPSRFWLPLTAVLSVPGHVRLG